MNKRPTLHQIIRQTSFDEVFGCMTFLKDRSDRSRTAASELFETLAETEPVPTRYHLHILDRWEGTSPRIDMTCTVRDSDDEIAFIIEDFPSLAELMSMEVFVDDDVELSEAEIIAGLLWELKAKIRK